MGFAMKHVTNISLLLVVLGNSAFGAGPCRHGMRSYTSEKSPLRIAVTVSGAVDEASEAVSIMHVGEGHRCAEKIGAYLEQVDKVMYYVSTLGNSPIASKSHCRTAATQECVLAGLVGDAPVLVTLGEEAGWRTCLATCSDGQTTVRLVDGREPRKRAPR